MPIVEGPERDEAKADLDAAIERYFGAMWGPEGGGVVTGYVLQISGQTMADMAGDRNTSTYSRAYADRQHPAMTSGLATLLASAADGELCEVLEGFDGD